MHAARSAIAHAVATRRLWRVHEGVFAVGRPHLTREGTWLAAVLACGEGSALSHLAAACLWGIREFPPTRPQVSMLTQAGRQGPRGIELHRTTTLRREDVVRRADIPVTTLARTLVDLMGVFDSARLKSAIRHAERLHRLDLAQLRSNLEELPRKPYRHARLRRMLDAYLPGSGATDSDLEADFLELCVNHGLPTPETQARVGPYRADFLWRDLHLVVETDGRHSHDGFIAFRDDRVRDRAMKAAGLEALRFTSSEVAREPQRVCESSPRRSGSETAVVPRPGARLSPSPRPSSSRRPRPACARTSR